jgi:hypothetical protein
MHYYREYVEVTDDPDGAFVAEVRLCHDFPEIAPNAGNQVAVLDERVAALMDAPWAAQDMPTDTWSVLAC